jgi:MerR family transcriptional regulator, light-induced transcriptional regulator
MFERLSSEPIYNTRAVVRRTGVPADTFRAWERRYGVPSPLRTSGNQRLYSERDIRKIIWLREQTAVGLTISQAIRLMQSTSNQVLTASAPVGLAVDPGYEAASAGTATDPLLSARRQLVDAFTRLDGQAAEHILTEAGILASIEVVLVELLHGSVVDIAARDDLQPPVSPALHFARSFVQRKFASLFNVTDPNDGRGPLISASVEGETQDLTLLLSAILLSRAGFRIIYLGSNLPFDALVSAVTVVRPAALCLAATTGTAAATLKDWNRRLAAHTDPTGIDFGAIPICYSGRVFLDQPQLRDTISGRFLGHSAQDSVAVVESALADHEL